MRQIATRIHRWAGLFTAFFLIVAGLTGAVTSWDHELDEWLNADIMRTQSAGAALDPFVLAAKVAQADKRVQVTYIPLGFEPGHAASFLVRPLTDPKTNLPFILDYNTVFIDPVTAQITGTRDAQAVSLSRRSLMPFLRTVHYSLHIPAMWGTDRIGYWIMGSVALVWFFDSFVAFCLTLPRSRPRAGQRTGPHTGSLTGAIGPGLLIQRRSYRTWFMRWKPSWLLRWRAGGYKLKFDLHRAGGLWVWAVILVVAFTSFSLNLYREVFYPVMSLVSKTTPGPYETQKPAPFGTYITPTVSFADAVQRARTEAKRLGIRMPAGGIYYGGDFAFYNVSFFDTADETGAMGMGLSNIYIDAINGQVLGDYRPWHGTGADVFVQLQLPLHSGRILGLPGRILMSLMGLAVALLSVTGIVIWIRKKRSLLVAKRRVAS